MRQSSVENKPASVITQCPLQGPLCCSLSEKRSELGSELRTRWSNRRSPPRPVGLRALPPLDTVFIEMKASSLVGLLTAVVLMATTASAPPPGPTPRVPPSENMQDVVLKKPVPNRKGTGQPSRYFRPAKKRTSSPYYTGHRSVAFLTMGEIDVIQRFPEDLGTASPMDPCLGCCIDIENHISATGSDHEPPVSPDINPSHNSMTLEPGLGAIDVKDLESITNYTTDHCLGCCDAAIEISTPPMPPVTRGGGAGDLLTGTAPKGSGTRASGKTTQNQPLHRPREKTTRWGSSAVSSSEEGGMGKFILRREGGTPVADRTEMAERPIAKYNPSQKRKKMNPCLRHGCKSVPDSSSMSSSEEGWGAVHIRTRDTRPSPAKRG